MARGKGLDIWFFGLGSGRVDVGGAFTLIEGMDGAAETVWAGFGLGADGSLTEIVGMDGVTEMEGAEMEGMAFGLGTNGLLIDIVGIDGVTDIEGSVTPRLLSVELIEIVGVSWIEIVGTGGAGDGLERVGGVWETLIVGMGGVVV